MKPLTILFFVVFLLSLTSCMNPPVPSITQTQTNNYYYSATAIQPSDFVYVRTHHRVVKGESLDQIARLSGTDWPTLLELNPGLKAHQINGKWYVDIYPGDSLNMGGIQFLPVVTGVQNQQQQTPSNQTQTVSMSVPIIPWWGWLAIIGCIGGIALLIWLIGLYRPNFGSNNNSAVRVDIHNGIDLDTRRAIIERDQDLRDRTLKVIEDGATNGRLKEFFIEATPERLTAMGSLRGNKRNEPKQDIEK